MSRGKGGNILFCTSFKNGYKSGLHDSEDYPRKPPGLRLRLRRGESARTSIEVLAFKEKVARPSRITALVRVASQARPEPL